MNIIFLGTPEFADIVLNKLLLSKHNVVAVVTQEDKPSGRGNKLKPSPVKVTAIKNNIELYQFRKIRKEGVDVLKSINAEIMVTAAYGQILSKEIIDICPHKIINVHGSLLPKYRGATPIQTAIKNGDKVTGVTIMNTDVGVDTGDILSQVEVEISDDDTYGTLSVKMAESGADLLIETLDKIQNNQIVPIVQDELLSSHTKMINKEDSKINFNQTGKQVCDLVRALNPNPIAYFDLNGQSYRVFKASFVSEQFDAKNGEVIMASGKKGLVIKCLDGAVLIDEMQAPNSKVMTSKSYLNGKKIEIGSVCNE